MINSYFSFSNIPSGFYTIMADPPAASPGTEAGIVVNGSITTDIGTISLLAADTNNDSRVNILDWPYFAEAFDSIPGEPKWNPEADFNYDGVADVADIYIMKEKLWRNEVA